MRNRKLIYSNFVLALLRLLRTPDGKFVLAFLKTRYVTPSAIKDKPELTYHALAERELIQKLINISNDPTDIDRIINNNDL